MVEYFPLFFPQWQGSGKLALNKGAKQIKKHFSNLNFSEIYVSEEYPLEMTENILGFKTICAQLNECKSCLNNSQPKQIFTLGGDCSVDIIPINHLNRYYSGDLAVIWLDAHADLNTPETSPSHLFHGMPLRVLLEESSPQFKEIVTAPLKPEQVSLIGTRDYDPAELEFIKIHSLSQEWPKQYKNAYIHIDLDVLDPIEFPHVCCPSPGGLTISMLNTITQNLRQQYNVVGFSLLECSSTTTHPGLTKIISSLEILSLLQ